MSELAVLDAQLPRAGQDGVLEGGGEACVGEDLGVDAAHGGPQGGQRPLDARLRLLQQGGGVALPVAPITQLPMMPPMSASCMPALCSTPATYAVDVPLTRMSLFR